MVRKKVTGAAEVPAEQGFLDETIALSPLYAMPGHLIRRSQQIAVALFAEEVGPLDLTPVQFAVLFAISTNPGIEAARMSELIAFDRSTLGDVLDRLSGKGLIDRSPSKFDGRAKTLALTPSGEALVERSIPAVRRVQERILAPLPPRDRERYLEMMRKLVGLHTGQRRYIDRA